jgi:hypothetical protein
MLSARIAEVWHAVQEHSQNGCATGCSPVASRVGLKRRPSLRLKAFPQGLKPFSFRGLLSDLKVRPPKSRNNSKMARPARRFRRRSTARMAVPH